jgi:hypothetical protein
MSSGLNLDLYKQVQEEREKLGLTVIPNNHVVKIKGHELLKKQAYNTNNERIYHIVGVHKQWCDGWFLVLSLEKNGTLRQCFIDNISCQNKSILLTINSHREIFEVL